MIAFFLLFIPNLLVGIWSFESICHFEECDVLSLVLAQESGEAPG